MIALKVKPKHDPSLWVAHYGGSFNPIHNGHLKIARILVDEYGFDRVIFVPNGDLYRKAGLAPEQDRLSLICSAIQDQPAFTACDFELHQTERPLLTIQTLQYIHDELSQDDKPFRLFSIRGLDAVKSMHTWHSKDQLLRLCTLIAVTREGTELEDAASDIRSDKLFVLHDDRIPDTSSSQVRSHIFAHNIESADIPLSVQNGIRERGMYGVIPPGDHWINLYRPGYSGKGGRQRDLDRTRLYGTNTWRTAFQWGDQVITYTEALMLYEDSYVKYFQEHPDKLDWICSTACNVYDNSNTNVLSGTDYTVQEALSTHLQDVAVRRALIRLGRTFQGDHLVEIRGMDSEGFDLNPGQVPFVYPETIVQPEFASWWRPQSVESFWQANKIFQVKERAFSTKRPLRVFLAIQNSRGDLLAKTIDRNGKNKPEGLPSFTYTAAKSFKETLAAYLIGLNLMDPHVQLSSAPPVGSGQNIGIILWTLPATDYLPPSEYQMWPLKILTNAKLDGVQRKLFRKFTGSRDYISANK